MQHIIFDLDGTLIDSKPEIVRTYRAVFAQVPPATYPDMDALNCTITINDLLRTVYGEGCADIPRAKAAFMSIYDTSDYQETVLYEGVYDTLTALKEKGAQFYIATNKRYYPTTRILQAKKIDHLFAGIVANEKVPGITPTKRQMIAELKQQFSFTSGVMVGDSVADIKAGKEEGLRTVAVAYGYEDISLLARVEPDFQVDSFKDLYTFVG
jgi:phosphoglycolate phosphatase